MNSQVELSNPRKDLMLNKEKVNGFVSRNEDNSLSKEKSNIVQSISQVNGVVKLVDEENQEKSSDENEETEKCQGEAESNDFNFCNFTDGQMIHV